MKKAYCFLVLYCLVWPLSAKTITVDDCITMATDHSMSLKVANENVKIAKNVHSQAVSNYFPHIGLVGSYQWNQKNLELIDYGSLMYGMVLPQEIRHLTRIDIQNVIVGDVALVQPIFMGGKIVAANQIANYGQTVAENNAKQMRDNVSLLTQENYWLVVSLAQKRTLAHSMVMLLEQTQDNVNHLIEEGVATPSDLLNVNVRLNEMRLAESKINQNLTSAKLNLMQLCGIDLNDSITLEDEMPDSTLSFNNSDIIKLDTANVYENRTDISNLELEKKISQKEKTIALSSLLPNVVLNANYFVSNPNLFNGFDKSFDGMFNVGVSVTVPITDWIGGGYKINSAKAGTHIKELEIQAAKDNVQLEMRQALLEYEQAANTLSITDENRKTAEQNYHSAELSFTEGLSNALVFMETQTAWLKAETEFIDAQINLHLSELTLQKVYGQVK